METPTAKALLKDDEAKQKTKDEKAEQSRRNKSQSKEDKSGKTAALSVLSSSSKWHILPKTPSAPPELEPPMSPLLNVIKHQFQTQLLTPHLQKMTIVEKFNLTMEEGLKPGHGNVHKVTPAVSRGYVSCTTSGPSACLTDFGKSKSTVHSLPTTWTADSVNITQQDSNLIPKCLDDN